MQLRCLGSKAREGFGWGGLGKSTKGKLQLVPLWERVEARLEQLE
jgi:hypothetical protein